MTLESLYDNKELWDRLVEETGLERHIVQCVVKSLLYGGIVRVCVNQGITIEEAVAVRCAFDDFVEGRL
jgi:hypothetical protein